jgi:hypothetical protein
VSKEGGRKKVEKKKQTVKKETDENVKMGEKKQ